MFLMKKKIFIFVESILYLTFICFDIFTYQKTIYIKYLGIVLCFAYCLINNKGILKLSSLFTLVADYFLLVIDDYYEIGVSVFIIVQIFFCIYLSKIDKVNFIKFLLFRFLILIVAIILFINNVLHLLYALVLVYFSNLIISFIESLFTTNKLLKIGLLLFICCDICVGLFNLRIAYDFASMFMWIFYLPSQVLIVLI